MDQKLGHAAESGFTRATRDYRDSGSRSRAGVIDRSYPNRSARRKLPKMMMRAFIYLVLLGSLIVPGSAPATAQDWPTRLVKVVVPVGPGGVTDTLARLTADRLAKMFGKPFVVENRGGGGGAIGTEYAARAPNDGYTIYLGGGAQFIITPLIKKLSYDPV